MRAPIRLMILALVSLGLACMATEAKDEAKDKVEKKMITTKTGLQYLDEKEGTGDKAQAGDVVEVHYTGTFKDGKKFDSSVDRGKPFSFKLGAGQVIKGWDEGVAGMRVGGKRKLVIPYQLAYGEDGRPPVIPPKSELHFDVELLTIK